MINSLPQHMNILLFMVKIQHIQLFTVFEPDEKITKRYNKEDTNGNKFREIDLRKQVMLIGDRTDQICSTTSML